jgi:superfamily I DNA/RNA helicase
MVVKSAEQKIVAAQRSGLCICIANAGCGKTTTATDSVLELFDYERTKIYPKKQVLGPEEVQTLLGLFLPTTFTQKAAEEFDHKIKAGLRERGILVPEKVNGREFRISRTLDSFIQGWLGRPAFFEAWLRITDGWANSFAHLVDHLTPATRDFLRTGENGEISGSNQVRKFYYRMPVMLTGEMQRMIAGVLVRQARGPLLAAELMPKALLDGFFKSLALVNVEEKKWGEAYWQARLHRWREEKRIEEQARPENRQDVPAWKRSANITDLFINLYQIARTRGYQPLVRTTHQFLGTQALLEAFASSDSTDNECLQSFHAWALAYEEFKRAAGFMDFSDCLEAAGQVFYRNSYLLEKNKDYPLMGFRRRYPSFDEVQDFTPRQLRLAHMLCPLEGTGGMGLFIGDGKQSIYAFAGSSPYAFSRMVREGKQQGDKVFTLTSSFRSARSIVALGNEIAATLPSYAASTIPSNPIFTDEGEISVSPPLVGEEDEATWLMTRIDALLQNGETSIMVVFRTEPEQHPIAYRLKESKYSSVRLMTIHKSKGLEARHVFIGGCTAGRFPTPLGDALGRPAESDGPTPGIVSRRQYNDQECNLFYVAATRARWSVTFSLPRFMKVQMAFGETRDERTGPSPFMWEVPTLRQLCLASGWKEDALREGAETHHKKVEQFYSRFFGKFYSLNKEAKAAGFKPGSTSEDLQSRDDTTVLGVHEILREKGAGRSFDNAPKRAAPADREKMLQALQQKLRASFFRNGSPPDNMKATDKDLAFQKGLIEQTPNGTLRFTQDFKELSRAGQ